MDLFFQSFKKFFKKKAIKNNSKIRKDNEIDKKDFSSGKGINGGKGSLLGPKCQECHGYGHLAHECINALKRKTNFKANITWDDSHSDSSEVEQEDKANFTSFVASLHSQTDDKSIYKFDQGSSDDSENEDGGEFDDEDDLRESYDRLYRESVRINKVNLKLIGNCQDVNVELLEMEKRLGEQQGLLMLVTEERDTLRKEAVGLREKNRALGELNSVYEGSKALDDMLNSQRSPSDKSRLGFYGASSSLQQREKVNEKKHMEGHIRPQCKKLPALHTSHTHLSHSHDCAKFVPICHFCGIKGHIRPNCFKLHRYLNSSPHYHHVNNKGNRYNCFGNGCDRNQILRHKVFSHGKMPKVVEKIGKDKIRPIWVRKSDFRPWAGLSTNSPYDIRPSGVVDLAF
ncbi:hypothetical protein RHGRI_030945 [Rhododendron griersonianum]|uniref:CCHC-type domain-containing protein n=1 Tax=Rhododendron griersonianum TaxID=479676 RepID=A0AAV6I6R3_9ERIC|nr:hypothetical protein RHGRI_030945 [Rhododendron griersonianum]